VRQFALLSHLAAHQEPFMQTLARVKDGRLDQVMRRLTLRAATVQPPPRQFSLRRDSSAF
jgi:hypothetical protein